MQDDALVQLLLLLLLLLLQHVKDLRPIRFRMPTMLATSVRASA
jgi:hypothetical protein